MQLKRFEFIEIEGEFLYCRRNWIKKTDFGATCIDFGAPYEIGTIVAIDRMAKVWPKEYPPGHIKSVFRKGRFQ